MGLEIRLPEALTGAVGERGDGVGGQAQQRAHLGGRLSLHLRVPEHHLPTLRQRREGGGHHLGVLAVGGDVEQREVDVLGDLAGHVDPAVLAAIVVEGVADAGHEVGAERHLRPATALEGRQDPKERLRHEVIDIGTGGAETPAPPPWRRRCGARRARRTQRRIQHGRW